MFSATDQSASAMVQEVSRRRLTVDVTVPSQTSLCGLCGGQSNIGEGCFSRTLEFPCQFHSTDGPQSNFNRQTLTLYKLCNL
jgi:hypothetical protein